MKSVIVYGSRHGNTEKVARAIAAELSKHGDAKALAIDDALTHSATGADLLVIGGPTEAHGITPPVKRYLETIVTAEVMGKAAAAFDTRLNGSRWLTGAAGEGITRRLQKLGARIVAKPESFLVTGKTPALMDGELERASVWAAELAAVVGRTLPLPV